MMMPWDEEDVLLDGVDTLMDEEDAVMDNKHPLFEASVDMGKQLFQAKKAAVKEGAKGVPFGMRHLEPAEFRAEMERGGEEARRRMLLSLEKQMGGKRQAIGEYLRRMGGR